MTFPDSETSKIGKKGVVVIPARLRRRYGLESWHYITESKTC